MSSSLIVIGGTTCRRLKWVNGHSPRALHAAARSTIGLLSAPAALYGTSGSRVPRSRTSSMAQNTPSPRTSPTDGWRAGDLRQRRPDDVVAEVAGVLDDALLLEDVDAGDRRGAGQRVAGVREPAGVDALGERVGDRPADDHAAERDVARVDALGEADQVRRHAPAVDGEPLAAAAEPGHHLVGDHHDAVVVAQLADALQVAVRRDEDAVRADDGLEHDGGDRCGRPRP